MYLLLDLFNSISSYIAGLSFDRMLSVFWFLFFIEIPRYYILDIIVLVRRHIRGSVNFRRDSIARSRLWLERPFVSVIVPGKNEGRHVFKLTRSLKEQTYPHFDIVVVDDGSDDDTELICRSLEKNGLISRFFCANDRGGKASAANLALFNNKAEIIVHLDADSSLDRNAIEELLLPFYWDANVGAVGGCVKVRNGRESLCTTLQELEYLETIMVGRSVTSDLNLFRTISGAFGAFRRDVLTQVGAWDVGPGLDGDITQKIRKSGYKVVFAPKAVCLTNVPVRFFNLFKQRLRWSKSLIRFRLRKHINVLDMRYQSFNISNFITNVDNLLFNFVFDIVWVLYMISLIVSNPSSLLELFVLKFLIMQPLGFVSFAMIYLMTERRSEERRLLRYMPLQTFYSGYFLRITRVIASIKELFFFSSYKDSWNPAKSSRHARFEGL